MITLCYCDSPLLIYRRYQVDSECHTVGLHPVNSDQEVADLVPG